MNTPENIKDRITSALLTSEEVIAELRLDYDEGGRKRRDPKVYAMRRLKYLRMTRAIPFIRLGHRSYIYPRQGIERFKKQKLVEAYEYGPRHTYPRTLRRIMRKSLPKESSHA